MRDRSYLLVLIVFGIVLGSVPDKSRATTVLPLNLDDLCGFSSRIVVGKVDSSWQVISADRTHVWTVYRLNITEQIKGETIAARVEFVSAHGTIDSLAVEVAGSPKFEIGDELLLFLNDLPNGHVVVEGLTRGVYRVRYDDAGQRRITSYSVAPVIGVADDEAIIGRRPSGAKGLAGSQRNLADRSQFREALSLEEFSGYLRGIVFEQQANGYQGRFREYLQDQKNKTSE